jgi:hypothetical protein
MHSFLHCSTSVEVISHALPLQRSSPGLNGITDSVDIYFATRNVFGIFDRENHRFGDHDPFAGAKLIELADS